MAKSCPKGEYFCNTKQKCRPIPDGCKVDNDGILIKENELNDILGGALKDIAGTAVKEFQGTKTFQKFTKQANKFEKTGKVDFSKLMNVAKGMKGDMKSVGQSTANNALDQGNAIINQLRNKLNSEEVEHQGGISMEPYTKDTKFHEVETVDIITPEPLRPSPKATEFSDWRVELDK